MNPLKSLRGALLSIGAVGASACLVVLGQAIASFATLDADARASMVSKDVIADILPPPMYLIEMRLLLSRAIEGVVTPQAALADFERLARDYDERAAHWRANPPHGLERLLFGEQHDAAQSFMVAARSRAIERLAAGDANAARDALASIDALYLAHRRGVDTTVAKANAHAQETLDHFERTRRQGLITMCAAATVLLAAMLGVYLLARRSILVPLNACVAQADRVAGGDLSGALASDRDDEIGRLQRALADMTRRLSSTVGGVRDGVEAIVAASQQIAEGNRDLSARTESQAANLQQTSAAMEELAVSLRQAFEHTGHARELARQTCEVADRSQLEVGQMVETMGGLRDRGGRIAGITGVIDAIALQTNLLALNAAIEAARAGAQGRGFAVVACEVRSLASRSAEAAREIRGLIEDSTRGIDAGHASAQACGESMSRVVAQVQDVALLLARITGAGEEQQRGVDQTTGAVQQLDATTQANAALVQQTAAAAGSLHRQADQLAAGVAAFRLGVAG